MSCISRLTSEVVGLSKCQAASYSHGPGKTYIHLHLFFLLTPPLPPLPRKFDSLAMAKKCATCSKK